jgi:hypothetical protein
MAVSYKIRRPDGSISGRTTRSGAEKVVQELGGVIERHVHSVEEVGPLLWVRQYGGSHVLMDGAFIRAHATETVWFLNWTGSPHHHNGVSSESNSLEQNQRAAVDSYLDSLDERDSTL